MTSPSPFGPSQYDPLTRANWLGRYLDVENDAVKRLSDVLGDAADSIDESFKKLIKPANFSQQVRKSQLALVSSAIRKKVKEVFGDSTDIIRNGQQDAAVAAVNAQLYEDRSILSQMFGNATERTQYADSLRQTASRNIDAVMTRVLETEQPLSQRVYHTQALATGQVNQLINRALAKGDSAADLAKAVTDSIKPDVPGGVAYAAKRLARTELNNAFHAQSIHDSQETPWVEQMEWNLSKTHAEIGCLCEKYARTRLFAKENVPEKPHPNCRCFVTPKSMDYETFENSLVAGHYDNYIDSVMGDGQAQKMHSSMSGESQLEVLPPKSVPVKEVSWTGPKVAKPIEDQGDLLENDNYDIDKSAVLEDIDQIWTSIDFDEFKGPIRQGARIAQREGFSGIPRKTQVEVGKLQEDTSSFSGPDPGDRSDELLQMYGKELVARAVHNPPLEESVWRGVQYKPEDAQKLVEGQRVSLPLSSFSDDEAFASDHATGMADWQSVDAPADGHPILFELLPGAKTADMTGGEFVAFGQFEVVNVEDDVLAGIQRVQLQQTSMIEHTVEKQASKSIDDAEIPEIDFIDERPTGPAQSKAVQKKVAAIAQELNDHILPPNTRLVGFDNVDLDHQVAQRFSNAVEHLSNNYPMAMSKVTSIGFGDAGPDSYGYTLGSGTYPSSMSHTKGQTSKMVINDFLSSNHASWVNQMTKNVEQDRFHQPGSEKDPVGTTVIHEFGHVLQNMFGGQHRITGDDVTDALFEKHKATHAPEERTLDNFQQWLQNQLSGYSFQTIDTKGTRGSTLQDLDVSEAIAEAFSNVEKGFGTDAEKALHELLASRYREFYGG